MIIKEINLLIILRSYCGAEMSSDRREIAGENENSPEYHNCALLG
jgi:hypothetical protein